MKPIDMLREAANRKPKDINIEEISNRMLAQINDYGKEAEKETGVVAVTIGDLATIAASVASSMALQSYRIAVESGETGVSMSDVAGVYMQAISTAMLATVFFGAQQDD